MLWSVVSLILAVSVIANYGSDGGHGNETTVDPQGFDDSDVENIIEILGGVSNGSDLERQIYFPGDFKGWYPPQRGWGAPPPKKHHRKGHKIPNSFPKPIGGGGGIAGGGKPNVLVDLTVVRLVTCSASDKCHNFAHCASYHHDFLGSQDRCCLKTPSVKGICCSAKYPHDGGNGNSFNPYDRSFVRVPKIGQESVEAAAQFGKDYGAKYKDLEVSLIEQGVVVPKGTPAYGHLQFFQTSPQVLQLAQQSLFVVKATVFIQEKYYLGPREAGIGLQDFPFTGTVLEAACPRTPECNDHSYYRTYDGSCNNLNVPKLGQSSTPLIRLLPPAYADGVWAPRRRRDGGELPNARFITRSLVPDFNRPDVRYSHLLMQHGQFVDHDLTHVPMFRFGDFSGISCCQDDVPVQHPGCFPISIPPGDREIGNECMNFVRSMVGPRIHCDFGHADQLNQLTHWLDGSQIYGSTVEQGEKLREFSGGFLKVTRDPRGRHLLPLDLEEENDCDTPDQSNLHCFVAGDKRVNEQIGLTSYHTVWLREHNRVAAGLSSINPHWDDEQLFNEARRIVVAEWQHITYNEWLPIIIGRNYMEVFGILPLYQGHTHTYNPSIDGSISNAFATAAFRMGHTLVQGQFSLHSKGGGSVGQLRLRDYFNNPHLLRNPGALDLLTKGLLNQPIQMFDNFVTTELRDNLFQKGNGGMDLIALNIQRGRDHGIPGYNEYRDLCRLGRARSFQDLQPIISPSKIPLLEQIYENVDDIDLFIGGIFENPVGDALLGPTFVCIIGDQFVRLQRGDRFFYSHGDHPHSFSEDQLHTIRSTTMSRVICDNSDSIYEIQPLAFHLANTAFNPMLPCSSASIPGIDLELWRD